MMGNMEYLLLDLMDDLVILRADKCESTIIIRTNLILCFMWDVIDFRCLRFHDLRHSCKSLWLANDLLMKAIQEWLSHSNYAITANLHGRLEYDAKIVFAETITRMLEGEAEQESEAPTETGKVHIKTTDKPALKKLRGRKKKNTPRR